MRATEAKADEMRRQMADAAGDDIRGVERYEVELCTSNPETAHGSTRFPSG